MKKSDTTLASVEEYIASFPPPAKAALRKVRKAVLDVAPGVSEELSYGLPTIKLNGKVVLHYGAFQHHIGLYATPTGHAHFESRLAPYKQGKGSVQFPLTDAMPLELIRDIAAFRWNDVCGTATAPTRSKKSTPAEAVAAYLTALPSAARRQLNAVREIILAADDRLAERIKWSAPSYHYKGVDLLTFGPRKGKEMLLVIHHPSIVSIPSPLLTGNYKDRRLVRFENSRDAGAHATELQRIIREMIHSIDSVTTKHKSHAKAKV